MVHLKEIFLSFALSLHTRIGLRSKDSKRKKDSEHSHDGNLYLQSMVSLAERSGDVARLNLTRTWEWDPSR